MAESNYHPTARPSVQVQIVGLNKELTHETTKADWRYEVYFDLSGIPSPGWINVFLRQWKRLNQMEPRLWDRVAIKEHCLVIYRPPQEIAQKHLLVLKLAVAATNKTHQRTATNQTGNR